MKYIVFKNLCLDHSALIGEEQESIDEQSPLGNSTN